jgi:DNA-binding transcriptional ArsR family regulator
MADVFDALADPKRRAILELVATKPHTTAAINKTMKLSESVLDKHLKMLVTNGLLSVVTKGKTKTYSINKTGFAEAGKWFGKFGSNMVAGQADLLGENIANLLSNAATWLEGRVGGKINLEFDAEKVGKELGKKLSDVKAEASGKISEVKVKVKKK